jgi:hypothetical protein
MKQYDLYGSRHLTVNQVRIFVEGVLGVAFDSHDSSYLGQYFLAGDLSAEHFLVRHNQEEEDYLAEPSFPDYGTLLQVNGTARGDELKDRLANVNDLEWLRRDVVE